MDEQIGIGPNASGKKGSCQLLDPFSIAAAALETGVGASLVLIATYAMGWCHK
jgi:hypothetical protein